MRPQWVAFSESLVNVIYMVLSVGRVTLGPSSILYLFTEFLKGLHRKADT